MSQWDGKSKGNVIGYRIFVSTISLIGIRWAYTLARLVTYYYYLFARTHRNHLKTFYSSALHFGAKKASKTARRNFFIFSQTLIDRIAFLTNKDERIKRTFENEEALLDIKKAGKGGILLSAHIGNWEMAGNLLKERVSSKINVVMLDHEVEAIKKYIKKKTGGVNFKVIPIKDDLSHVIKINNALSNNEFVAMHADRFIDGAKYLKLDFFSKKAKFPLGPFKIAAKFNVPVSFVFGTKEHKYHYHLTASTPFQDNATPEEIAKRFILELEKKVEANPEQWFNYYDFYN